MNKQDWKRGKIKDICDKASSNIAQNKIVGMNGEYPVFGASGFVQNVDFYHRDKPYIGIVKDGSGVGRVNLYPAYSSLLGTLQYIIPKDGNDIGFVSYALQSLKLSDFASGSAIPHIYFRDYGECEIPVPPLPTQQRIVAELDCISGILEKKRQQLKELDNLAQAIFYDMFGDPVENDKGWEVKKLGEVCSDIVDCPHSTPIKANGITDFPCIRTSELKGGSISWETMQYLEKDEYEKRISRLKPIAGDIVFGREGTIGDAVILPEGYDFSLGQRTMLFRVAKSIMSNVFLHRVILSKWFKMQIEAVNVSSTVAHVNIKDLKMFCVPLPPLSLQQQFAKKIEAIERQKALINQSIKEVQTLFDCRMEEYFN